MQPDERLRQTIQDLRQRFGDRIVTPLSDYPAAQALPSGFPALDQLLGGGIPRGRVMALCGRPSAGRGMLVEHIIAHAQRTIDVSVYLDLSGTFDGESAVQCGIDLDRLLVIRPDEPRAYAELVGLLVGLRVELIAVDASATGKPVVIPDWLSAALARSRSSALVLQPFGQVPATDHAAVRLSVERVAWRRQYAALTGCQVRVTALESRFTAPGGQVLLDIALEAT